MPRLLGSGTHLQLSAHLPLLVSVSVEDFLMALLRTSEFAGREEGEKNRRMTVQASKAQKPFLPLEVSCLLR